MRRDSVTFLIAILTQYLWAATPLVSFAQLANPTAMKDSQARLDGELSEITLRFAKEVSHEVTELLRAGERTRAYQLSSDLEMLLGDIKSLKAVPDIPARTSYLAELNEVLKSVREKQAASGKALSPAVEEMERRLKQLVDSKIVNPQSAAEALHDLPAFIHSPTVARLDEFVAGRQAIQASNGGGTTVEKTKLRAESLERFLKQLTRQRWTLNYEILDVLSEQRSGLVVRVAAPLEVVVSEYLYRAMIEARQRQAFRSSSSDLPMDGGFTYEHACSFFQKHELGRNDSLSVPKSKLVKPGNLVQVTFEPILSEKAGTKVLQLKAFGDRDYSGAELQLICGVDFKIRVISLDDETQKAFQHFRNTALKPYP